MFCVQNCNICLRLGKHFSDTVCLVNITGSCSPPAESINTASCFTTDMNVDIYFVKEETRNRMLADRAEFESLLKDEINQAWQDGSLQVRGLLDISEVGVTTQSDIVGVQQGVQNTSDSGIGPGGIIAAAAGSLVVVLLLLCLVLKRRSGRIKKIDENSIKDVESDTYYSRDVQVVGERESTSSGSSGWTSKKQDESYVSGHEFPYFFETQSKREPSTVSATSSLGTSLPTQNEHKCNSETCKICEEWRNDGVVFIKTGTVMAPGARSIADVSL